MAIESFGRPIVVTEKNVDKLIYAAEHPVDFSERYKSVPNIPTLSKEEALKLKEKHCK